MLISFDLWQVACGLSTCLMEFRRGSDDSSGSFFNVLAAASGSLECPMLEWFGATADTLPSIPLRRRSGRSGSCPDRTGCVAPLFRNSGHPVDWINKGFLLSRWRAQLSGRVQERILDTALARDDSISVDKVCTKVRRSAELPAHLKGRLRRAARLALDTRHQAAFVEDAKKETRAQKNSVWLLRSQ